MDQSVADRAEQHPGEPAAAVRLAVTRGRMPGIPSTAQGRCVTAPKPATAACGGSVTRQATNGHGR
ncbi:hypothetical protein GCM10009662_03890 [Catellatospora coxensis]|uniref:Uncharacterized protein n=1 Tax=Catellatospora coxensis TaxID=310354 RepID=A0A8J3KZY6_9ACTN|nr:hypothetical protein Cco03nite_60820 [Catellatospora coxensis]